MKKFKRLNSKKRTVQVCASACLTPDYCISHCAGDILALNCHAQVAANTIQSI